MDESFSNQAQFYFKVGTALSAALKVKSVVCNNDGISTHYQFHLHCYALEFIHAASLIGCSGLFYWCDNSLLTKAYRHGIVSIAHYIGSHEGEHHYSIILVSLMHHLMLRYSQRVFTQKTLYQTLSTILETAGLSVAQFTIKGRSNPQILYQIQYQQTDYCFFQTLLKEHGYQFVWHQDATGVVLTITDDLGLLNNKVIAIDTDPSSVAINTSCLFSISTTTVMTKSRLLQAGQLVMLQNRHYRIGNIAHHVEQDPSILDHSSCPRYQAEITLVGVNVSLYATDFAKQMTCSRTIPLFTCTTETIGGRYPFIDEQGCYYTRLPFDASDALPTQASAAQALLQPHGGGQHLPLQAGSEMVVTHIERDISQPILLGALSNVSTATVVNNNNNSQHILRSWGGNQLLIDDQYQHEKIQINNPRGLNELLLDATANETKLSLQSQGEVTFNIEQDANLFTEASHYQTAQQMQISVQKKQQLQSHQQYLQSGRHLELAAANNVAIQAETIHITTAQQGAMTASMIRLQSQTSLQLESTQEGIQLYSKESVRVSSGSDVTLIASDSKIIINSLGMIFSSEVLTVNAAIITCPQPS